MSIPEWIHSWIDKLEEVNIEEELSDPGDIHENDLAHTSLNNFRQSLDPIPFRTRYRVTSRRILNETLEDYRLYYSQQYDPLQWGVSRPINTDSIGE